MISTEIFNQAASLLKNTLLVDKVDIYKPEGQKTIGFNVVNQARLLAQGVPSLVQSITLDSANESLVTRAFSVKVPSLNGLKAGDLIVVMECEREPSLVGKALLLDSVSENGLSIIKKAISSDFYTVNQEGKGAITWQSQ